jgi:hypothetical protein
MANQTTPFLGLEYITLNNRSWLETYQRNLVRLDKLGKMLRTQLAAGKSSAIRTELANGSVVDAITIIPDPVEPRLTVYLGRQGKGDKIVIESSTLFSVVNLSNQNALAPEKICSIGASWYDEDGIAGDAVQDVSVVIGTRNNLRTTITFPPASPNLVTRPNNYVGSTLQLETDPGGDGTGTPHLKFVCETTTGTKTYIVPAYTL